MSVRAEALLFMASRAELVEQVIRPALKRGDVVVSDRYVLANVVYQAHAGGLNTADLWSIGQFCTGDLEPDLTFVLDVPYEVAVERRGSRQDRVESRGQAYFDRVRAGFLYEAKRRPNKYSVIDATGTLDEVQACLQEAMLACLESHPQV
jgi:dTMP kinase